MLTWPAYTIAGPKLQHTKDKLVLKQLFMHQSPSLFREAVTYGKEDPGPGSFIHKLSLLQAPD